MSPVPDHGEQTYCGSGRLSGKKAMIRGGDSGIVRAVSIALTRWSMNMPGTGSHRPECVRSGGYKVLEVRMGGSDHAGNASDLVAPTNDAVRFVEHRVLGEDFVDRGLAAGVVAFAEHVVERLAALSENPTMG
jgi:hypothetical protein